MLRRHSLCLIGSSLLLAPTAALAQRAYVVEQPGGPAYLAGEILVEYRADSSPEERAAALASAGVRVEREVRRVKAGRRADSRADLDLAAGPVDVRAAAALLRRQRCVVAAEPNWVYQHQEVANDPLLSSLWGLASTGFGTGADAVWAGGFIGSATVVVGVIDEGIQIAHPDLAANIWTNPYDPVNGLDDDGNGYVDDVHGWDFSGNSAAVFAAGADTHGTHVAGTIGAVGGNALGVVGVNWNVRLISGKFLGPTGGTTADAIEAVDYFARLKELHPDLDLVALNNSWGGGGYSGLLHAAIIRAANQGILFVAAAGNGDALGRAINNDATAVYPANYDTTVSPTGVTPAVPPASYNGVVAVTSINSAGAKSTWANYGANRVHLAAPGEAINSTYPDSTYASLSGTSMATPHVTGALALLAASDSGLSADQLRKRLLATAVPTASVATTTRTGGRLNLPGLLTPVGPGSLPTVPIGVRAGTGSSQILLSWVEAVAATGYSVQRATAASGPFQEIAQVVAAAHTDATVQTGTAYHYRIAALNANGASAPSATVSATVAAVAPTAPASLTATVAAAAPTTVRLAWTDRSNNETGFGVEISTNNRTWTAAGTTGANATGASVNGLARRTRYYFRVRALGNGGLNSAYTASVQVRTL